MRESDVGLTNASLPPAAPKQRFAVKVTFIPAQAAFSKSGRAMGRFGVANKADPAAGGGTSPPRKKLRKPGEIRHTRRRTRLLPFVE
jgi:hypothetical protein